MPDRKHGFIGGIVRGAQLHPWRTIEHCTLVLLILHLLSGRACNDSAGNYGLCPTGQHQCCCSSDKPGPLSALQLEGVSQAPAPTMSLDGAKPGHVVEHHDFRGDIYRFVLGDGIVLNLMRTTAGTMRSGDLHNCTQFDVVLQGKTRLYTYDTEGRQESAVVYGRNDFIAIPARVPHLFEFLEENYMIEWWDCDFRAWYYKPYRDRIAASFAAAAAKEAKLQSKSGREAAGYKLANSEKSKQQQPRLHPEADSGAAHDAHSNEDVAAQEQHQLQQAVGSGASNAAATAKSNRSDAGESSHAESNQQHEERSAGSGSTWHAGWIAEGVQLHNSIQQGKQLEGAEEMGPRKTYEENSLSASSPDARPGSEEEHAQKIANANTAQETTERKQQAREGDALGSSQAAAETSQRQLEHKQLRSQVIKSVGAEEDEGYTDSVGDEAGLAATARNL